jgi:hypothetical protein
VIKGPSMSQQNTVRNDVSAPRAGMRIVHSRNWTPQQRQREAAIREHCQEQIARRERRIQAEENQNGSTLKLGLAAAGLCASLFWVGYAVLQWKHLL